MLSNDRTFDTFVINDRNRFAHDAALAVAENPAEVHNPLVIWGVPGVGKTHLLLSIRDRTESLNRWVRSRYVTTHSYRDQFLESLPANKAEFRRRYHELDMLLIDDVQDLANREGLEETFLIALDTLLSEGKQVVMTCDSSPSDLPFISERLKRRILSGLTVEIQV